MLVTLSTHFVGATLVIRARGVAGPVGAELPERLVHLVSLQRWTRKVVVDLSGMAWMHPEDVRALFVTYWRVTETSCWFAVVAPHNPTRDALLSAKVDWLIPVYATVDEAVGDERHWAG